MWDLGTAQVAAGVIFLATIAGAVFLSRAVYGTRLPSARVVARRDPARWTEVVWLAGTVVAQLWSLGVILLPAWFYGWPVRAAIPGVEGLQILGLGLWAAGGGLVAWSAQSLGRFMTPSIQVTEGHRLVQDGPYALMRHPTYTANVAVAVGLGLAFLSVPLLVLAVLMAALAWYRAGLEETLLASPQGFGPEYTAYMARTGRFLPRFRRATP